MNRLSENASGVNPMRIVIVGAGFGGTYAFKYLHRVFHRDPRVALILVNPHNYFLFTPLLHEVATGGVSPPHVVEPLRKVLGCCLQEFWLARVESIDPVHKTMHSTRGDISYDYLVLAPGAETDFSGVPGARTHALILKSLIDAVRIKNRIIGVFEDASKVVDPVRRAQMLHFIIVGGGATGVELAAELSEFIFKTFAMRFPAALIKNARVTLLHRGAELLGRFSPKLRSKSYEALTHKGIDVRLSTLVEEVGDGYVRIQTGERLSCPTVIWTAGVKPALPVFTTDIPVTSEGRVKVNEYLQIPQFPELFVIGDAAAVMRAGHLCPLPPSAQVAVKEAHYVARAIRDRITGRSLRPFSYRHRGDLVSLGQWMAVGEIARVPFWGPVAWWLWRTVYLSKLLSWQKKLKVSLDWTVQLFSPRDISEL